LTKEGTVAECRRWISSSWRATRARRSWRRVGGSTGRASSSSSSETGGESWRGGEGVCTPSPGGVRGIAMMQRGCRVDLWRSEDGFMKISINRRLSEIKGLGRKKGGEHACDVGTGSRAIKTVREGSGSPARTLRSGSGSRNDGFGRRWWVWKDEEEFRQIKELIATEKMKNYEVI
jgi:hypothetical protein